MGRNCGEFYRDLTKLSAEDQLEVWRWVHGLEQHITECLENLQKIVKQLDPEKQPTTASAFRECLIAMLLNTAAKASALNDDTLAFFLAQATVLHEQAQQTIATRLALETAKEVTNYIHNIDLEIKAKAHSQGN